PPDLLPDVVPVPGQFGEPVRERIVFGVPVQKRLLASADREQTAVQVPPASDVVPAAGALVTAVHRGRPPCRFPPRPTGDPTGCRPLPRGSSDLSAHWPAPAG